MNSNTYEADWIDKIHFAYTCPFCWTKVNRDGRPRKNARNIQHIHGSNQDLSNRIEQRSPHHDCPNGDVYIIINDNTKKIS